jgi:3-methyladenine DNA glycosylase AlkD
MTERSSSPITAAEVLGVLRRRGSRRNVEGMARYGIAPKKAFGVPAPAMHAIARRAGKDHRLALGLWRTGVHDARILACLVAEPDRLTRRQAERWALDFDSWALCDTCCMHLLDRTPYALELVESWAVREEEYVRRAAFALIASLAVHDKRLPDAQMRKFLRIIRRGADDPRPMVRKAVNWALRQIGKRNLPLNGHALALAARLRESRSAPARWVGSGAHRELSSTAVARRLKKRATRTPVSR